MTDVIYTPGKKCTSLDNKHTLEFLEEGMFYAKCSECDERFLLLSETVYNEQRDYLRGYGVDFFIIERPTRIT